MTYNLKSSLLSIIFFLPAVVTSTLLIGDRLEGVWERSAVAGVKPKEMLNVHIALQAAVIVLQVRQTQRALIQNAGLNNTKTQSSSIQTQHSSLQNAALVNTKRSPRQSNTQPSSIQNAAFVDTKHISRQYTKQLPLVQNTAPINSPLIG